MGERFPQVLLVVHAVLLGWGVLGLIEYFVPAATLGLQNASFPPGTQFLHFASVLVAGAVYVGGYLTRWPSTVFATVTMYAVLATICFIETVDFGAFGGGPTRFLPMAAEYVTYALLSTYLLRSATVRARFPRAAGEADARTARAAAAVR
ncbi:MAG: hypothetical protein AAGH15_17995 [Myxococcota bacterium]